MLTVTNSSGRSFNIRVVNHGDRYGVDDCLTHEGGRGKLIEFYDATYIGDKFGPRGQFVSRYYASTLADGSRNGLCLNGGVPEWSIDADAMRPVYALAETLTDE